MVSSPFGNQWALMKGVVWRRGCGCRSSWAGGVQSALIQAGQFTVWPPEADAESAWGWGVMSATLGAMAGLPAQALSSRAPKTAAYAARQREWREVSMAAFSVIPSRFRQTWWSRSFSQGRATLLQSLSCRGKHHVRQGLNRIFPMDRIMTFVKKCLFKERKCPKKPRMNSGNI